MKKCHDKNIKKGVTGTIFVNAWPTWEVKRRAQLHQSYIAVMAPVVVVLVVDDLLHGVPCVLGHFSRAAGDDPRVDHPAGHLR